MPLKMRFVSLICSAFESGRVTTNFFFFQALCGVMEAYMKDSIPIFEHNIPCVRITNQYEKLL